MPTLLPWRQALHCFPCLAQGSCNLLDDGSQATQVAQQSQALRQICPQACVAQLVWSQLCLPAFIACSMHLSFHSSVGLSCGMVLARCVQVNTSRRWRKAQQHEASLMTDDVKLPG